MQKEQEIACNGGSLHRQLRNEIDDIRGGKSSDWLKIGYLKKEMEHNHWRQDQVLCTDDRKKLVYGEGVSPLYRMCGVEDATVTHIIPESIIVFEKMNL